MMARSIALSLALSLCAPSAPAQGSPLTFETSNREVARWIQTRFTWRGDLPECGEGMRWHLSLDDGGQLVVETRQGAARMFECTMRPGALMELFADRIGERRAMLQGMFAMGLGNLGVKTADAVKTYRALLEFPAQIAQARLRIDGDPSRREDGFDVQLSLDPAPGTWFERFATALRPNPAGAPAIADDDIHMVLLWCSSLNDPEVLAPFTEFFAGLFADAGGSRERRVQMVKEMWEASDGSFAMTWDFGSEGYYVLQGITDADRMQRLYDDDDFKSWIEAQYQIFFKLDPSIEDVQFVPNGFEYRGIKMHKTIHQGEEGESFGIDGITREYAVSALGMRETDVKALLDRVLDGQVARAPLPDGVLGLMRMRHLSEWDLTGSGRGNLHDAPERVDLTMSRDGKSLLLRIEIR